MRTCLLCKCFWECISEARKERVKDLNNRYLYRAKRADNGGNNHGKSY